MSDIRQALTDLVARILEGSGHASRTQRSAAFENAGLVAPVGTLIEKVAKWSYKVTDKNIAAGRQQDSARIRSSS